MNKIVRRTAGDPLTPEQLEHLKKLAEMPDDQINTDDIPERRFGLKPNLASRYLAHLPAQQRKAS